MCPYSRPKDAGTFGCARLDPRIDADTVRYAQIPTQMTCLNLRIAVGPVGSARILTEITLVQLDVSA